VPLAHTGFSGARLTRLTDGDGQSYVLKRLSIERDWIMRATDDVGCREAAFAAAARSLPAGIATPTIGVARDGGEQALLMHDISDALLPQGAVADAAVRKILERVAELHRSDAPGDVPWCDLRLRLTLLTPERARIAAAYGAPVARDLDEGWRLFAKHATPAARALIEGLFADATPLLRALEPLPAAFLHGDLKFDNIGIGADGRIHLIDWAMPLVAASAVEIGWFLAINSRRTTLSLDEQMRIYAEAAAMSPAERATHDALSAVCGLLLRGWRKALDAEDGEPGELRWWCERVEAAAPLLR
jgi:hypothetical protein